jgi:hypothetical protein
MKNVKVYNNSSEVAIRMLALLNKFNEPLDIQQLVFFDYLLLHLGDISSTFKSLHSNTPYHKIELFVRRKLINDSINLLISKELIVYDYSAKGIRYKSSEMTNNFLKYFESKYFNELVKNSKIVYEKFHGQGANEINSYIKNNYSSWDNEFEYETLFRGEGFE